MLSDSALLYLADGEKAGNSFLNGWFPNLHTEPKRITVKLAPRSG